MRWSICSLLLLWGSVGWTTEIPPDKSNQPKSQPQGRVSVSQTNQAVKSTAPRPLSGAALEFFLNENFGVSIAPRPVPGPLMLPGKATGSRELELQEVGIAMDALREENKALQRSNQEMQRDLNIATQRVTRWEAKWAEKRRGLAADDSDARSSEEWRAFLLSALKTLGEGEHEERLLLERLRLLHDASREALKFAQKVAAPQRSQLEVELRQAENFLGQEKTKPIFLAEEEGSLLKGGRVIGVNLDLGVAALGMGRKQGVRVGMPFVVSRGKTLLAVLDIAEVRETASLAIIEQMDPSQPIKEGDTAELRKN